MDLNNAPDQGGVDAGKKGEKLTELAGNNMQLFLMVNTFKPEQKIGHFPDTILNVSL